MSSMAVLLGLMALVVSGPAAAGALNVDFGSSAGTGGGPNGTQADFDPFEAAEGGGNPDKTNTYGAAFGSGGTVDVTIGGYTHFRNYAGVTGTFAGQSALLSDSVLRNSNGTMTLTLTGLESGLYEITTYHHGTANCCGTFDVRLHDAIPGSKLIADSITGSKGTNPSSITTETFTFLSDGSPVGVDFGPGGGDKTHMTLNGFELDQVFQGPVTVTPVLSIDFDDRGASGPANTEPGFDQFLMGGIENNELTTATTRTFGAYQVTIDTPGSQGYGDRRRGEPTNSGAFTQQELLRDFVFFRGTTSSEGADVLIENLEANTEYAVTIWSVDDSSAGARTSDWFANGSLVYDNYAFNGNDIPPAPAHNDVYTLRFLAATDGDGDLLIEGRWVGGTPGVFLNALQLSTVEVVPEPATLALVAMGVLGWGRQRRHARRA